MIDMPVTLIVKAPNQQVEDQTIQCELNWSIQKLKGYLSEVYPSKPRTEDQKLIYSGQLLEDSVVLKDILRWYEGQDTHTVHLVCMPSRESLRRPLATLTRTSQRMSSNRQNAEREGERNTDADGLRQRLSATTVPGSSSSISSSEGPVDPRAAWAAAMAQPYGYDPNNMAHQLALMQQAYAQYMTQYLQLLASGAPRFLPPGQPSVTSLQATPEQPVPPAENPAVADQPNNEALADGEEEEDRGNRDWLYWFYMMSRVMVLFSIVYFYSSPTRFLIVSILGIIMYLYHKGFLQVQQLQAARLAAENNNEAADNNNMHPEEAAGENGGAASRQPRGEGSAAEEPAPVPERPSLLAVTWTFFTSFFASLIPEHHGAL